MNSGGAVVIEDDDMDIIEILDDDEDQPPKQTEKAKVRQKGKFRGAPAEIKGYTKPTYSYCQMITQALAASPGRRATFFEICDLIITRQPYYKYYTGNWRRAIYSALAKRKKFFVPINSNSNGEYVWSLNPAFEKLMMDKWVPKRLKKISVNPAKESLTPVIVSATSLSMESGSSSLFTPDESLPEFVLADPDEQMSTSSDSVTSTQEKNPWEPEITVSETETIKTDFSNSKLISAVPIHNEEEGTLRNTFMEGAESSKADFSLSNISSTIPISSDEESYRITFMKEHPDVIEKFRLHCTVCDCHLGTSGAVAKKLVRLHAILGVLTCITCFTITWNLPGHFKSKVCTWCFKGFRADGNFGDVFSCSSCPSKFCEDCVKRNFGTLWCNNIRKGWLCFLCNTKQIWPHRAIALSLLHHYSSLKTKMQFLQLKFSNNNESDFDFYTKDLSSCCKGLVKRTKNLTPAPKSQEVVGSSSTGVISMLSTPQTSIENFSIPSTEPATSNQQMFIVEKQSPGHIYVQSSLGVPSVTLNTGTQYIHNVYPNKNYVVVHPPNLNRLPSSSTMSPTSHPQLKNIPMGLPQRPSYSSANLSNNPCFTVHHRPKPMTIVDCESAEQISTNKHTQLTTPTVSRSSGLSNIPLNVVPPHLNPIQNVHILPGGMLVTNRIEESGGMIVPDVHQGLNIHEENEKRLQELSIKQKLKEKIERRPMPKSKKQSLLRAVLMSESIESMKKQLQTNNTPGPSPTETVPRFTQENTSLPVVSSNVDNCVEEPILKSIIQTATERLLNLQKKQFVPQSNSGNEIIHLNDDTNVSKLSSETDNSTENKIPKIKIKTLQELQEYRESDKIKSNEDQESNKESDERVVQNLVADEPLKEINVTGLKQGIIESSRTLVSTQKRFKELAKVISSNLSYQTEEAAGLVKKFQDILKSCSKQIESIDKNIQNQYGYLIPNNDIDMIMESIKNTQRVENSKLRAKWCKKHSSKIIPNVIHQLIEDEESSVESAVSNVSGSNKMENNTSVVAQLKINIPDGIDNDELPEAESFKRKRDLVHFNPLGKKVILGTPEVTEEDLQQFPNPWNSLSGEASSAGQALPPLDNPVMKQLLKRQNILRSSTRKRCIWDTKRRKSLYFRKNLSKYNKDGSIKKRLGRPRKSSKCEDLQETYPLSVPKPKIDPRLRMRITPPLRPLRSSERKRAEECIISYLPMNYVIKPCSVVIHTLDPKIVQLWEKRIRDERLIPE